MINESQFIIFVAADEARPRPSRSFSTGWEAGHDLKHFNAKLINPPAMPFPVFGAPPSKSADAPSAGHELFRFTGRSHTPAKPQHPPLEASPRPLEV